ncbi:MAG: GTP pyrophosphokinase [Lachnospiraceae bacterium]|nr:GTP pyrophosphokinase [Lachnospiraceae bacterium]
MGKEKQKAALTKINPSPEEQIRQQMEEQGLREQFTEVVDKLVEEIQKINIRLSKKCNRQIMDNIIWRIKSPDSIVRKLQRKGLDVSLECAKKSLNDLVGIRIICSFQDDVYRMAKAIKKMTDFKIVKEKNYIANPKASGYRSIHLIGSVQNGEGDITVEIQIRSVAMNYWAILDHQLCYKNEKKEVEFIRKELKDYAVAIAKIDKKFFKLRKMIEKL